MEPRKACIRVPTPSRHVEGNIRSIVMRDAYELCVVEDPIHVQKLFARESGDPTIDLDRI